MTDLRDQLIDRDLGELLGGEAPPDLIETTLARIENDGETQSVNPEPIEERGGLTLASRIHWLSRLATAACVLLAIGLIAWVLWPQSLPASVAADETASYRVDADHIELRKGWLLVTDGAPEVRIAEDRVSAVQGRAVVGSGVPSDAVMDALADQLKLNETEKDMLKSKNRWLMTGSLALCLLTGHAVLNGETVRSDDLPQLEVSNDEPKTIEPEDIAAVRKFLKDSSTITVNRYGHILKLEDKSEIERVTDVLATDEMKVSDADLSFYDPWDWVFFTHDDGSQAIGVGLSQGSDSEKGLFDLILPGWDAHHAYTIPDDALPVLKDLFKQALKQPKSGDTSMGVLRKWNGADSEVTEARVEFITDAETWAAVWQEHTINPMDDPINPPKLPDVDFNTEVVLAVFGGAGSNSKGYFVDSILQAQTGWVVRVDEQTYQTAGGAVAANPYGIFVLPKVERTIVVEENVQGMLGKPPLWKQLDARMSASGEQPPMLQDFLPSFQRAEAGSHDAKVQELHVISDVQEWEKVIDRIDVGGEWETPDFDTDIAVIALGTAQPRMGSFLLDVYGLSSGNLHLRLIAPYAQSEKRMKPVEIFGVWVLAKPANGVVIETPRRSMNEPAKWLQEKVTRWED